jgi:hypothetical protein
MGDDPLPLYNVTIGGGADGPVRIITPAQNVVEGRKKVRLHCKDCAQDFNTEKQMHYHVVKFQHVCWISQAVEFVPVHLDDSAENWVDGANVTQNSRDFQELKK